MRILTLCTMLIALLATGGCKQFNQAVSDIRSAQTGPRAQRAVAATNETIRDTDRTIRDKVGDDSGKTGAGSGKTGADSGKTGGRSGKTRGRSGKPDGTAATAPRSGPPPSDDKAFCDQMLSDMRAARLGGVRPGMPRTSLDGVAKYRDRVTRCRNVYKKVRQDWRQLLVRNPSWPQSETARRSSRYRDIGGQAARRLSELDRSVLDMVRSWHKFTSRSLEWMNKRTTQPSGWNPKEKHQWLWGVEGAILLVRAVEAPAETLATYQKLQRELQQAAARVSGLPQAKAPKPKPKPNPAAGDEKRILVVLNDGWRIKRCSTVGEIRSQWKHGDAQDIAVSADGQKVILLNDGWRIKTFDASGKQIAMFKQSDAQAVACNGDGSKIVVKVDNWRIRTFDPNGKRLGEIKVDKPGGIAMSGDGKRIIVINSAWRIKSFDAASGKQVAMFKVGKAQRVATNWDGSKIVVVSDSWHVYTYDPSGKKLGHFRVDTPGDVAMSPDGKRIVVISDGWRVKTFDAASGKEVSMFKVSKAQHVAISGK